MCQAFFDGNTEKAKDMQLKYLDLINALFVEVNPIPVKTALNLMGYNAGNLRLPLIEMEEKNLEVLKNSMKSAGLLK